MKTRFTIWDVLVLKNGNLAITGLSEKHLPITKRGKAATVSGDIEVEIISVGIVDPSPADRGRQDLQVRLLKGATSAIKGAVLFFEDE